MFTNHKMKMMPLIADYYNNVSSKQLLVLGLEDQQKPLKGCWHSYQSVLSHTAALHI